MHIHFRILKHSRRDLRRFKWLWMTLVMVLAGGVALTAVPAVALDYALDHDGEDDYAFVPFDPPADFNSFTIQVRVDIKSFNAPNESFRAWLRAVDQLPPKTGYTKTSESIFLLCQSKTDPRKWCFYLSNNSGESVEIEANSILKVDQWIHLAVTYDGNNIKLYQDGRPVGSGSLSGTIPPVLSLWFGRWVAATYSAIGMVAIHSEALSDEEVLENAKCGPTLDERLFAYWPITQDANDDTIIPEYTGTYTGFLGSNKAAPLWIPADYQPDSDGDGVADCADNCYLADNANQYDQDGDGFGDACDDCNLDGLTGDGGECDWVEEALVGDVNGLVPSIEFTWGKSAYDPNLVPDTYMVPQDCDNTVVVCYNTSACAEPVNGVYDLSTCGDPLPSSCGRPWSYTLTVAEDENVPGGDLVRYRAAGKDPARNPPLDWETPTSSTTIQCSLTKWYDPIFFESETVCVAIHIASTYDRNYDPETGECKPGTICLKPEPKPEDDVPDFQYSKTFVGRATSNQFVISPRKLLTINLRHTSYPNNINVAGGDGDVTVAIYGEETFNPADYADYFDQIRLSGVSPAGDSGSCVPGAPKSADIVSLTPGSAHPDDPIKPVDDLIPDLVLHFKESALCVSEGNTQAQLTWPLPGMSVFGYDEVTTR
ncbi:MAG: hypothetical protein PVG19_00125 [Desulfobacterales bacterium]|jgi:hypothetical protein